MIQTDMNVNAAYANVNVNANSAASSTNNVAEAAGRIDRQNTASSENVARVDRAKAGQTTETAQEKTQKAAENAVAVQDDGKVADVAVNEKSTQGDELKVSVVGQLSSVVGAAVVANSNDGIVADVTPESVAAEPIKIENITTNEMAERATVAKEVFAAEAEDEVAEQTAEVESAIEDISAQADEKESVLEDISAQDEKRKEIMKEQQEAAEKSKEALKQAQQNMNGNDSVNAAGEQEVNLAGKSARDIERLYRQGDISAGQYQRAVQQLEQSESAEAMTVAAGTQNRFEIEDVALLDAAQNGRSELMGQILGMNNTNV